MKIGKASLGGITARTKIRLSQAQVYYELRHCYFTYTVARPNNKKKFNKNKQIYDGRVLK